MDVLSTKHMITPLLELGLNKYEAKVYLTLISEGVSTAKNISDITSIPYGKVYEVVNALTAKGFVTTLPSKPMKCQAINPKEALKLMKTRIEEQHSKLEKQIVKELIPLFEESRKFNEPKSIFWSINGRANINNKVEELVKKAKKYVYFFISENGLKRLVIHKEPLKEAHSRNVELFVGGPVTKENLEDIQSLDFCKIKHLKDVPGNLVSIDGNECIMVEPVPDDDNILYGRDLGIWITSPSFTKLLENSFLSDYKKSKPVELDSLIKKFNLAKN